MMVSVIVPVYNISGYLERCLQSILSQTYVDLEIILVDDGSEDSSGQICDQYAEIDNRIRVIHKKNGGLVSARKAGVSAASGDYVVWVDGDDWIEPDWIGGLVKVQENSGADLVAANLYFDIGEDSRIIHNGFDPGIYETREILHGLLYSGVFYEYGINPHMVTKIWKRERLSEIQGQVDERIMAGEDAAVTYPYILGTDSIFVTDLCGYHYVQHPGAMTKTVTKDEDFREKLLLMYLENCFRHFGVESLFRNQLRQYGKYLAILRQIEIFDCGNKDTFLQPFGEIAKDSRVVIYGAGGVGQSVYRYLQTLDGMSVVGWADRNYKLYREFGFSVDSPEFLMSMEGLFDFVIIANINRNTALNITGYLVRMGIDRGKICWFSEKFLTE